MKHCKCLMTVWVTEENRHALAGEVIQLVEPAAEILAAKGVVEILGDDYAPQDPIEPQVEDAQGESEEVNDGED